MVNIQAKMKGWIKAMKELELEIITNELEILLDDCITKETNKSLFKLLLHLSHTAYECDRSKTELGLKMWELAFLLCSNISEMPDFKRFFPSIFHITKCLLEMKLYAEAMEIFDFVMPNSKLWTEESFECEQMYLKASTQWKCIICNDLLRNIDPKNENQREIAIKAINYELKTVKLSSRNYSQLILERMIFYCKHTRSISKRSASSSLEEDFQKLILSFFQNNKILLNRDENEIFKLLCQLVADMIAGSINEKKIHSIGEYLNVYFDLFRETLYNNRLAVDCFDLYKSVCRTLLIPIETLTANTAILIKNDTEKFRSIMIQFRNDEPVKSFLYSIFSLLSPLLAYWEESAKTKYQYFAKSNIIVAALKLFSACSEAFEDYRPSNCRCDADKCRAKYDMYSAVSLKLRSLSVASRVSSLSVTEELCSIALKLATESVSIITEMKNDGCKRWMELWASCGAYIYNMGISCETSPYSLSYGVKLHSLLLRKLIELEGLKPTKPIVNLKDPLSDVLHRLTSVHFNNGHLHKASIFCALNGLLSYEKSDSKAYRYWANIQRKDSVSHAYTMLQFLQSNSEEVAKIVNIQLKSYDQIEVCLREIKGFQESRVDLSSAIQDVLYMMQELYASPAQYAQGVQMLGYHLLNFKNQVFIREPLRAAMYDYERDRNPSPSFRWTYGQLQFYKFNYQLAEISEKTQLEMKGAEFLNAFQFPSEWTNAAVSTNVVPSYSTINLMMTIELEGVLKLALQRWEEALVYGFKSVLKPWEISQTIHAVKIAGEYARLYHFETLEIKAWKLAYKLAKEVKDEKTIIYVTTRSLSGPQIDSRWIEEANKYVKELARIDDRETKELIARYKLCLANFYFTTNQRGEAIKCFREVASQIGTNFLNDVTNHLLRNDIAMNHTLNEDNSSDPQMAYHAIIVEILYGLLTLNGTVETVNYGAKEKQLYDYDVLLEYTNNISIRANTLLSFQEISSHLNIRLSTAQKLGAALRVAECLKSLCYIDLSRGQLDDCEVKLHGLEDILDIKAFDSSARNKLFSSQKNKGTLSPSPTRFPKNSGNTGQNDASPVLRKKPFSVPDFTLHGDSCECFKCTNKRYQYLVLASTNIRAQLYAQQRNNEEAMQHFTGAFALRKSILMKNSSMQEDGATTKNKIIPLQRQQIIVEYVILHLDYCRFLKSYRPSNKPDVRKFSQDALNLCKVHLLENHPIYTCVNELMLECRFEETFTKDIYSKFTVPAIEDIDISSYLDESAKRPAACSTPAREMAVKEVKSVRRKKTPPFLKLNKVPIDLTEEDEDKVEPPPMFTPTPSMAKRLCHKITEQNFPDTEVANPAKKISMPKIKVTKSKEKTSAKTLNTKAWLSDDESNVAAGISLITSISLNSVGEDDFADSSQSSGQCDQLVDMVDNLKIHSPTKSSRKTRIRKKSQEESGSSSSSSSTEASGKPCETIDKITGLFDEMSVDKPETSSLAFPSGSSKSRKPAKDSDCGRLKKSSLVSWDENTITLSTDDESDMVQEGKRASARLRKKRDDLSIPKSSSLKSLDKSAGSASNDEDEVVISTRTRKRAGSSATKQATSATEVSKSTRSRVTKKT